MTREAELLEALRELQKQLHVHIKLDVKKHYSLMVADAAASKAIAKAENSKATVYRKDGTPLPPLGLI